MWWECGECGARLERTRPTTVCPSCGTAGAAFVPTRVEIELDAQASSLRESWFNAGFEEQRGFRYLDTAA